MLSLLDATILAYHAFILEEDKRSEIQEKYYLIKTLFTLHLISNSSFIHKIRTRFLSTFSVKNG